jgi:hypothetical protein
MDNLMKTHKPIPLQHISTGLDNRYFLHLEAVFVETHVLAPSGREMTGICPAIFAP